MIRDERIIFVLDAISYLDRILLMYPVDGISIDDDVIRSAAMELELLLEAENK